MFETMYFILRQLKIKLKQDFSRKTKAQNALYEYFIIKKSSICVKNCFISLFFACWLAERPMPDNNKTTAAQLS
jgi:hypothetical protein